MITSELQKAYNLNNPKGGYSYYTLYRGESTDTKPAYAQTGDVFEEYGTGKVYTCVRTNGKSVWTEDPNAKRQTETGSGGGAEKFVVTLTRDAQTEEWTADKTVAEIVEAYEANQVVVAQYVADGLTVELPINAGLSMQGVAVAIFIGFENAGNDNKNVTVACGNEGSGDSIQVTKNPIPTSSNAPLIVTMTEDAQNPGTWVGDKTFGEVYTAVSAGKTVYISAMGNYAILNSCGLERGTYTIVGAAEGMTFTGTENDYLTITQP